MAGLMDYINSQPAADPQPAGQDPAGQDPVKETCSQQDIEDRQKTVESMQETILQMLQEGAEPEFILYTAVNALELCTGAKEWADAAREELNAIYADLLQQSLTDDNERKAAARRQQRRAEYKEKLRKQISTQLSGCRKIQSGLLMAMRGLEELEPDDPEDFLQ